ncbi:hypothetical protein EYF80_004510 [Liparis tanakae]|uniref:Uncharacterized protein n=1 Tax=Liparis tanakae TaxID=230148 RepID=A0A4Z2J4Q2_9TELE|nr:hypothetical protein EYF80_004510 [Liparis tanakae]
MEPLRPMILTVSFSFASFSATMPLMIMATEYIQAKVMYKGRELARNRRNLTRPQGTVLNADNSQHFLEPEFLLQHKVFDVHAHSVHEGQHQEHGEDASNTLDEAGCKRKQSKRIGKTRPSEQKPGLSPSHHGSRERAAIATADISVSNTGDSAT